MHKVGKAWRRTVEQDGLVFDRGTGEEILMGIISLGFIDKPNFHSMLSFSPFQSGFLQPCAALQT
jgi:hypothetical protein